MTMTPNDMGSGGKGGSSATLAGPRPHVSPQAAEAVAQVWGSLFLSPDRASTKTIMVTSAESGEGVTQIAAALALMGVGSDDGRRIALVDFNVRSPGLSKMFGEEESPGVVEVVAGQVGLDAALVEAGSPWLNLLPAGHATESLMPLLRSDRLGGLIQELAEQHDHVIIDAPAINRSATAQLLAGLTDGVITVVKTGVTRREAVAEAKKRVELAGGKILGMVLNQRSFPIPGFLYRRL